METELAAACSEMVARLRYLGLAGMLVLTAVFVVLALRARWQD